MEHLKLTKLTLSQQVELKRTWQQHAGALRFHAERTVPHARQAYHDVANQLGEVRLAMERAMREEGATPPEELRM
jgi:hypothetical protein